MKSMLLTIVALAMSLLASNDIQAQSFRCADATTRVERAICSNAELSLRDLDLADHYQRALGAAAANQRPLRDEQRRWISARNRQCESIDGAEAINACLSEAYSARLAQLQAVLPQLEAVPQSISAASNVLICDSTAKRLETLSKIPRSGITQQLLGSTPSKYSHDDRPGLREWAALQTPPLTISREVATYLAENEHLASSGNIQHLPGTNFYASHSVAGTMHCYNSFFFEAVGGVIDMRAFPRGIQREDGACMVHRQFGVIDNTPVMLEELFTGSPAMTSWLTIASWQDDRFAGACRINFEYVPLLSAAGRNTAGDCSQEQCVRMQQVAGSMTEEVQNDTPGARARRWNVLPLSMRKRFVAAAPLIEKLGVESSHSDPMQHTDQAPIRLPYADGERLYVVSLGHVTIGWRYFADWQIVFHEIVGDELVKRGTFNVGMEKGTIKSMRVEAR